MAIDLTKLRSFENDDCGYIGWIPGWDYMNGKGNYDSNIHFKTWKEFYELWKDNDTEFNSIVNYYFSESVRDENDTVLEVSLNMWLLHPRKGASRSVKVEFVKELELEQVKEFLKIHFKQIQKWFEWAI